MIIWGGLVNSAFPYESTNTGGRYDPSTDVWRATTLVRAPDRRNAHTAVWTGSQMIIWGGGRDPESIYANTGGVYSVGAGEPVTPTSVVSRKPHGAAGLFDISLPLSGSTGIECRSGGSNQTHQIVFTFSSAVNLTGVAAIPGASDKTAVISSVEGSGTSVLTVTMTSVSNAQIVNMTLRGVNNGTASNDITVAFGILLGDTTGNGIVNSGDTVQTRNRAGQAVDATNFRSDVNADGLVNVGDTVLVRAGAGTTTE